jgi:hypothetical protein
MTIDTELADFNWHYLSRYGSLKFFVAGRFWDAVYFDKSPIDPFRLACEYYARHGFTAEAKDPYVVGNRVKYKSVDELVAENPAKLSDVGQHLYDGWLAFKKALDAKRGKEPELPKVEPPMPVPPVPEPKPLPEIKIPQPKKPRPEWLVKFSLIFGALSSAAGVIAWFYPPMKAYLMAIVPLVQAIIEILGRLFT